MHRRNIIEAKEATVPSNILILPSKDLSAVVARLAESEGIEGLLRQQCAMLEVLNIELDSLKALAEQVNAYPAASSSEEVARIREKLICTASTLKVTAGLE